MYKYLVFSYILVICVILLGVYSQNESSVNIQMTYKRILSCLLKSGLMRDVSSFEYPDDAEEHYKDLLKKTENFRGIKIHSAGGYHGPWIENIYIDHFMKKPLSYFNGLIPLFVQFVDIHVESFANPINESVPKHSQISRLIAPLLRENVLYVAVTQDDQGLAELAHFRPNILSISAGGYGHVPLPLIKGNVSYLSPPAQFKYDVVSNLNNLYILI